MSFGAVVQDLSWASTKDSGVCLRSQFCLIQCSVRNACIIYVLESG